MGDITVCVPTIPPRRHLLQRAVNSVAAQTLKPHEVIVTLDEERQGAPATRDRALRQVTTEWVAFLDDDDEMKPEHLEMLRWCAKSTGADYVFSYYTVKDSAEMERPEVDPLGSFGRTFDPKHPHQTTITTLVRTELAQQVGFREPRPDVPPTPDGNRAGEDWAFTLGCVALGANIVHLPHRTWFWHHHGANTSGRPDAW